MNRDECRSTEEMSGTILKVPFQKFRSPPPKPPRRRHSDQLSLSLSGTFPSTRKQCIDDNQTCRKDVSPKIYNNKSGCGSLPANWNTACNHYCASEIPSIKNSFIYPCLLKNVCEDSSLADKSFMRNNISLSKGAVESDYANINMKLTSKEELQHIKGVMKNDRTSSHCLLKNLSSDCLDSNMCNNDELIMRNRNNCCFLKPFPKEYHRRHHSDPVLSYVEKSPSRTSLIKSAPQSFSFQGCSASDYQKKFCKCLNMCCTFKEIHNLFKELKILKEINDKLWQHLCSVQASFDSYKKKSAEENNLSVSDVLSSLYYSIRTKESAMEERLKIAYEERDAAVLELEDLLQVLTGSFESNELKHKGGKHSNKDVKELLHEMEDTENTSKLLYQQRILSAHVYHSKELKQDRLSHELKFMISERNNLLEKVKQLEDELKSFNVSGSICHSDNKRWESDLLNILCEVIQQRDVVLSKFQNSSSFDHFSCRSNFQKLHSAENYSNAEYELFQKQGNLNATKKRVEQTCIEDNKCSKISSDSASEIRILKREIMALSKALEVEVEKRESVEEKCKRLERLVNVLRKKINGQNVGIPV